MATEPNEEAKSENLTLDSEGCWVATIQAIIKLDESIHPKWAKLAHELDISRERIQKLRDALAANNIQSFEMCSEIIAMWVEDNGQGAAMGVLIQALVMASESVPPCVDQLLHLVTNLYWEEMPEDDLNWKDEDSDTVLHLVPRLHIFEASNLDSEMNMKMLSTGDDCQKSLSTSQLLQVDIKLLVQCHFIKFLINRGVDPNARNNENDTFLHIFILRLGVSRSPISKFIFHSLVEFLVEQKCLNLFDLPGSCHETTPLHLAVLILELEEKTLQLLHANGVNLNAVNSQGDSILTYSVHGQRSANFLSILINTFLVDPGHLNKDGDGFTLIAAHSGTAEALEFFMDLSPLDNDNGINSYWKPILCDPAEQEGSGINVVQKCKLLLTRGADVNFTPTTSTKDAPLELAALGGSLHVLKWMMDNGANPFATNKEGYIFLHTYLMEPAPSPSEFHDLVEYLLMAKGLCNIFNVLGGGGSCFKCTPMQLAILNIEMEERTFDLLQSHSFVDFQVMDDGGDSLLNYAIMGGRSTKIMEILIDQFEVDWKVINKRGDSLLHYAADQGNLESVEFCLKLEGLDVNGVDADGDTPLHCAVQQELDENDENDEEEGEGEEEAVENAEVVLQKCRLLIEKGADVNICNKAGDTPLGIVEKDYRGLNKCELVQLLSNKLDASSKSELSRLSSSLSTPT